MAIGNSLEDLSEDVPETQLPLLIPFGYRQELPALPTNFPASIPITFAIGDRVRWLPLQTATDWGTIIGLLYDWAEPYRSWQPRYCVLLDADSPSREWTIADWAWQGDLEVLTPPLSDTQSATSH